jgi:iron complex outermembrane receptor protein
MARNERALTRSARRSAAVMLAVMSMAMRSEGSAQAQAPAVETNQATQTASPRAATASPGAAEAVVTLPPVAVQGEAAETAQGPVHGFVAHRSAAGTKTDTPLIETPQAISVVTRDQMDAQNVQSINEALRYAPGVKSDVAGVDLRADGGVYIRGFLADQYLDGLKLFRGSFTSPTVEPWLLERIDIVHGPGSVLYGQASPGGFIDMVSKQPTETSLHELQLQIGSYGRVQGAFDFGGKATDDGTWLYRLSGLARDTGTQVDHTTMQRMAFAPSVTWKPDNDTKVTVQASFLYEPQGGFYNQLPLQGTVSFNPNGAIPTSFYQGDEHFDHFRRTQVTLGYTAEHRFNDTWMMRQSARYLYQSLDYNGTYGVGLQPNLAVLNRDAFSTQEFQNAIVLDNQAQADFTTGALHHTALFGVAYQYSAYNQSYKENATTPLSYVNPVYLPVFLPAKPSILRNTFQSQNQVGIYAQDQIRLDRWSLTVGGREDWLTTDTQNKVAGTSTSASDNAFSYRTALMYNFDIGIAPYFSYTTSFQPTAGSSFGGSAFKPTTGEQYEVGVKYQPNGTNAMVTVALFDLTQQNVLTPDPQHANFNVQSGEVRSRGVELEGKFSLAEGLNLTGSYTYIDNTTTKANNATVGKHPPGLPQHIASLWTDYAFQTETLAGLSIGGGVRVAGGMWANTSNTITVPGYALFDAMVRYDLGDKIPSMRGASVQLNATNIGDTRYIVSAQNTGAYYGLRRTILANLSYKW